MNLDLLYEVSLLTGDPKYAHIATRQAEVSMTSHVRPDYTTYHVVNFDQQSGKPTELKTHQGECGLVTRSASVSERLSDEQGTPMRVAGLEGKLGRFMAMRSAVSDSPSSEVIALRH